MNNTIIKIIILILVLLILLFVLINKKDRYNNKIFKKTITSDTIITEDIKLTVLFKKYLSNNIWNDYIDILFEPPSLPIGTEILDFKYHSDTALLCMYLTSIVYQISVEINPPNDAAAMAKIKELIPWGGFECVSLLKYKGMSSYLYGGMIMTYDDRIYPESIKSTFIVFRGIKGVEVNDEFVDFNYYQPPWLKRKVDSQSWLSSNAKVYNGFNNIYNNPHADETIREQLINYIQFNSIQYLIVAGHSIGGSIASLLGADIKINLGRNDARIYTFGAPNTGNKEFYDIYSNSMPTNYKGLFSIINNNDPISTMPLPEYAPLCPQKFCFTSPDADYGMEAHRLSTYEYNLNFETSENWFLFNKAADEDIDSCGECKLNILRDYK